MNRSMYSFASFLAGFSLMTIELISSRIVAPLIGTSVYTWTAVIGVTLLGLALGSYIGGIVADKYSPEKSLPFSFLLSSFFTFIVPLLSLGVSSLLGISNSLIILALFISGFLFLLPAIAIGLLQPIIVKKYVVDFHELGKKYGQLSTLWSLGSIFGVFLTGFYFISHIGSRETIFFIAILLSVCGFAIALAVKDKKQAAVALILSLVVGFCWIFSPKIFSSGKNIVYEKETAYYTASVVDFDIYPYGPSRALVLDFDAHTIEPKSPLTFETYLDIYPLFKTLKTDMKEIVVVGAGAYSLPKSLKSYYKDSTVSVIEIDPEIETISKKYFDLKDNEITTEVGDARTIFDSSHKKYDLVFGDAYNSFISVPGHLLTQEFTATIKKSLTAGGIYAVNFISPLQGDGSKMYKSVYATFASVFPNNYVLHWGNDAQGIQNITIMGVNSDNHKDISSIKKELGVLGKSSLAAKIVPESQIRVSPDTTLLTDNFYPVENLMDKAIKSYYPEFRSFMDKIHK